ncbi:type IV secretory system conjugative DNA transfer family protein [Allorhizocola rhizosphaerae]|uniref:type IV secretory system conjugative DNA transfer family protein n=1 Tax=Allorhizocola rhizosphaerae TaxID=1872709 RepID=UPI0013C37728|nr:type IV secretion system DNA-binding domain-containing protein [Allorhizocola rhizosphaerae]
MANLVWFAVHPPRDIDLAAVVAVIRPLASRPRYGLPRATPAVVFEVWSIKGKIHWLLGMDNRLAGDLPAQLQAHLPRLGLTPVSSPNRPRLLTGATVRLDGLSSPLRTELAGAVSAELSSTLSRLGSEEAACMQWVIGPSQSRIVSPAKVELARALGFRPGHGPVPTTERLVREKAAEPIFGVHGRIAALADSSSRASGIVHNVGSALKLLSTEHARLHLSRAGGGTAARLHEATQPTLSWSAIMSAKEVAAVIGWPVQDEVPDHLPTVGGHINLAPERLLVEESKKDAADERILGESLHPAQRGHLVAMPVSSAPYHLHVIGPTGSGKSTLLSGLVQADIAAGRGALVVEPRGDLIEDVLARIPAERRDDVVVIDPADAARGVVGLNVLAGPRETAERRADELVGLLAAMAGSNWGPRTADTALHAILTAARLSDGTLPDVVQLLTNPGFRRRALAQVADPLVLGPWWAGFEALSDGERSQYIAPLLNKIRSFLSRDVLRQMTGQSQPAFSFDDLFAKRRIVLVNLNRGLLGGPVSNLLGALVLSQVWSALQRRAGLPREQRRVVGLYVDEFQDYVDVTGGLDFGDALAQSRGLGGAWTLAHQHYAQLSPGLRAAVVANARSRISFRPGTDDARSLAAAFGSQLAAEDLLRLGAYEAVAQIHLKDGQPTQPFAVRTLAPSAWTSQPDELRASSAKRYGMDGAAVDKALAERWHGTGGGSAEEPIGAKPRRPR